MKREKGWEMFKGGAQMKDIAAALGVCRKTVSRWAKSGRWEERLAAIREKATEIRDADEVGKTVELLSKVDDSLDYVLDKVPQSRTRDLANTARAADHLTKARERLRGKSPDGEERGPIITLRDLVFIATGSDLRGDRIAGGVEDITAVSLGWGEEVIEAQSRVVEPEEDGACPQDVPKRLLRDI